MAVRKCFEWLWSTSPSMDLLESEARTVLNFTNVHDLREGVSFKVTGFIELTCERFFVNLIASHKRRDIVLLISPYLVSNYIVRNSKIYDHWGTEEAASNIPFTLRRGEQFMMQIVVTEACYLIAVNGHHFAGYVHRLPYQSVNGIEVKGGVERVKVVQDRTNAYPEPLSGTGVADIACVPIMKVSDDQEMKKLTAEPLSLPYSGHIPRKKLTSGRCLRIEGRIKLLPHSFFINLQEGHSYWPQPKIAFHMGPRYGASDIIIFNSGNLMTSDNKRSLRLHNDLLPTKNFSLLIIAGKEAYEVYLNRQQLINFVYCVSPDIVDTVHIQGDVQLRSVLLGDKVAEDLILSEEY